MIKSTWKKVPIKEIYVEFHDGPHATPPPSESGPIFLGIKNITENGALNLSEVRHISEEHFPKWIKRAEPQSGDIVFSYEATLHRYAIIPEGFKGCLGRRLALIRPNPKQINTRYLLYYFLSKEWRETISNHLISGATVDRIPLIDFPNFTILKPPLSTQNKIASILSACDDLIENNTRRIQILEEMAQRIYREWFVHFRFPGHENVKMVESELGVIPEGWPVYRIDEVATIYRGRSYRSSELNEEGKPFLNLKNVHRQGGFRIDGIKHYSGPYKDHQIAYPGDIILAVTDVTQERAIIARAARVPNIGIDNFIYSMDLIKCDPNNEIEKGFMLGLFLYSDYADIVKEFANGANVLHLSPSHISAYKFVLPEIKIRSEYSKIVSNIYNLCDNLLYKITKLMEMRDLLLPKLVSGQINVENLDIDIGDIEA